MPQVKVAIATAFPRDPGAPHGGVEAVSVTLVEALAALGGLELHVVTVDAGRREMATDVWRGVTVHRLPRLARSMLGDAIGPGRRQMQAYLASLRPDVVHAHDTYGLMVKGLSLPRAFTVHGFIHADTRLARGRWFRLRSALWRYHETRGWADQPHIIAISPYVRERLRGVARGVIHDIDNPIDGSFFQVRRRERKGVIFSAAVVSPRKNTLRLVEATARVAAQGLPVELRLAGAVTDAAYGERVRAAIDARGMRERSHLLGSLGRDQVAGELEVASVFALVSLEEGSPLGVEEAMAAGAPVVTSNRCGMPYLVRDGGSGFLVNPEDPEDVAWRLGQLLADDDLRGAQSLLSRRIARERFHPAAVASRTLEVYRRAIRDFTGAAHGTPPTGESGDGR
ncbi:MAG TPA: glycosyltransferase family 4 protein [Vicinamibacteria bacterium]|nr:glycosyltransferase family 4 protein [Vicinamibacteria bacterium]